MFTLLGILLWIILLPFKLLKWGCVAVWALLTLGGAKADEIVAKAREEKEEETTTITIYEEEPEEAVEEMYLRFVQNGKLKRTSTFPVSEYAAVVKEVKRFSGIKINTIESHFVEEEENNER